MSEKQKIVNEKIRLPHLSRQELYMAVGIAVLLVFALFFNLGVHPLRHEEPRRALIALEMIFRGNWIVPTEVGALYYNKPPVYNWLIIAAYHLFGGYSEFAIRFFSVLSFLGMGVLIFLSGRRYVGTSFGVYSTLFFLVSVEILYYFSLTGEIDLFYSLVTLGQLLAVFHFYRKKQFYTLFLLVYLLAAVGSLTKGLPSITFTGITLLAWLIYQRDFKKLFAPAHFTGILLYIILVGGYFWWYSGYHDPMGFLTRLYTESSDRTVVENGFMSLLGHLVSFPFSTLLNIMPATLLLIFCFRADFMARVRAQPFVFFCLLIFIANILLYWISPGTRARYVYMLYPFPVMIFVYFYLMEHEKKDRAKKALLHRIILGLIILVALAGIALPFVKAVNTHLENAWIPAAMTTVGALLILGIYLRFPLLRTMSLILLAVWVRVIFDITVIPIRTIEGSAAQDKLDAAAIDKLTEGTPLYVLEGSMISRSTVFYLERSRLEVLDFADTIQSGHYYMAYADALEGMDYEILYTFRYKEDSVHLVKFK